MCIGSLFGGGNPKNPDPQNVAENLLREEIKKLGGDPTGLDLAGLTRERDRLKAGQTPTGAGSSLPFVSPPPAPSPVMGLRLPRISPVGMDALKLPRR